MINLLSRLLLKRGIDDPNKLSKEEKQTFDSWQTVLSKEELTLQDVKDFCQNQVSIIESRWKDYNLDETKKARLIPYHTVYKSMLAAIDSPRSAREALERQLNQMLNQ